MANLHTPRAICIKRELTSRGDHELIVGPPAHQRIVVSQLLDQQRNSEHLPVSVADPLAEAHLVTFPPLLLTGMEPRPVHFFVVPGEKLKRSCSHAYMHLVTSTQRGKQHRDPARVA